MNSLCVVTFFYPGIECKIDNFFYCLNQQSEKKFDLIIFFNNKDSFKIPKNKINIKLFKLDDSITASRFKMIKKIKTLNYKYFVFQDADDLMKSNRVKICKQLLKKYHVVINDLDIYGNRVIRNYFSKRIKNKTLITAGDLIDFNFCGMSNTSIRGTCLRKVILPNSNKIEIFDWYFWTIILTKYKGHFTNQTTTKYFTNSKSVTHIPSNYDGKFIKKITKTRTLHKNKIKELIKKKKITNINFLRKNIIKQNYKFNFWWEIF